MKIEEKELSEYVGKKEEQLDFSKEKKRTNSQQTNSKIHRNAWWKV